ncbi:MAG: penicillin-binding protein 1C [Proteobacteria bacterium]|nr:MAG: penicillin-binding protein 1C [Pseudomonadota bacterium]
MEMLEPARPACEPRVSARWRRWLYRTLLAATFAGLALAIAAVLWVRAQPLPLAALSPRTIASTRLEDRRGVLLREVLARPDGRAYWVPLEQISEQLIDATLAGEDQRFYQHGGVDVLAVLRAAALNVTQRRVVSGASTVTMQLARLLLQRRAPVSKRRGLWAKARQVALAIKLEALLPKKQILTQYLNRAPYGGGCFGVEAAARRYFGKPASQLSLAESTLLAALPRSPHGYSPLRPRSRRRLRRRQRYLLAAMHTQGRIDDEQLRIALGEPLALERLERPFLAPHFVASVKALPAAQGQARVRTTLDIRLQTQVEAIVRQTLRALTERGVSQAAVLVVDNASGDVLAHVGSRAFGDDAAGQVDGTRALRQPGSAIKPFVYALAFERALTPASLLRDLPAHFTTAYGDYAPRNYDGRYRGPVRARIALASSLNVPAIRVAERVGVTRLLDGLRELGFRDLRKDAEHYGLGLALGNGEVTLRQLVSAYATLARGGVTKPLRTLRATGAPGAAELEPAPQAKGKRVLSARAAHLIADILSDPVARVNTFGRYGPLETPFFAAVKTGTSKDFRDNWTVGFTRDVTVGVWVGNFDGSAMHNVSGVTGAGPLWREVMTQTVRHLGLRDRRPERPEGVVTARICPLSGKLAGPHCPDRAEELFYAEKRPRERCAFHRALWVDRLDGSRTLPHCPGASEQVVVFYPPAYRSWAAARGEPTPPQRWSARCPGVEANTAREETVKRPQIRFPAAGDIYYLDADLQRRYQRIPLEVNVRGSPKVVSWLVDGKVVAKATYPFSASWPLSPGKHRVEAVLPDGHRSAAVSFEVR